MSLDEMYEDKIRADEQLAENHLLHEMTEGNNKNETLIQKMERQVKSDDWRALK